MAKPRISILDKRFKYRDSANTDVRATWRRAQLAQRQAAQPAAAAIPIGKKRSASC